MRHLQLTEQAMALSATNGLLPAFVFEANDTVRKGVRFTATECDLHESTIGADLAMIGVCERVALIGHELAWPNHGMNFCPR